MLKLMEGIRSILDVCTPIKAGERALVIVNDEGGSMWLGQLFMSVIESMGAETVLNIMPQRESASLEPPASVAAAMKKVDWIVQICEKVSIMHTDARKEATAAGAKFALVLNVSLDELKKGASASDIRLVKERTESISEMLTKAKVARITTPLGTNLTMSLVDRKSIPINPMGPGFYNIPYYAEAAIAPVEGTAEGTIVTDLEMRHWGCMLREPLRYIVKAGQVVEVLGSTPEVDRLRKVLATDANATNIAELGIGSSHIVPGEMKGSTQDFARLGTVHIAMGRNSDMGGKTWSRIHQDGLMSQSTIELDNVCIMKEGTLINKAE
jgi:leucyl aminopeptidase (aminopeptidase T)